MSDKVFPVQIDWKLTADFDEPRPLSVPPEKRNHVHGAWDIAVPEGTTIVAPENGRLYYLAQFRSGNLSHNLSWDDRKWFAFSNYFYDTFGGLIILEGDSGLTYVFAHIWIRDVLRNLPQGHSFNSVKEKTDTQGSIVSFWNANTPGIAEAGERIGFSGNAGFSTGAHIHLEFHRRREWLRWESRPNPADIWPLEAKRQKEKDRG